MDRDSRAIQPGSITVPDTARRFILWGQIALVLITWLYPVFLHRSNDGLWFQGDAPRHAAHGIFWKDFLTSGSLDPKDYALAYYARYPVISPAAYPPVFYILEGTGFALFRPSPYVAKLLVLLFSLAAALYLLAYIRKWFSINAGWSAALLPLLPGFVCYSNAVMLNVPATAAAIAALYHAREWLECSPGAPARKHFYLAAAFSVLAALTYLPAAIVGCIITAWLLARKRWDLFGKPEILLTGLVCAAPLIIWICLTWGWAPIHTSFVLESHRQVGIAANWAVYAGLLTQIAGYYPLVLAAVGIVLAFGNKRWRAEIGLLLILFVVDYVFLTVLVARDDRYGLLLMMPVICCCGIACCFLIEWICRHTSCSGLLQRLIPAIAGIALMIPAAAIASKVKVPRLNGIAEAVSYIQNLAPAEPVFYEGYYEGVFTFYLQSFDPGFKRRVVVGRKLLYVDAMNPLHLYQPFVSSAEDVIKALKTRGGCRYILVEIGRNANQVPAARLLFQAVRGPQFEFIRSFPVSGPGVERIDVYKLLGEFNPVDEVDLTYPALGSKARFRVQPIRR